VLYPNHRLCDEEQCSNNANPSCLMTRDRVNMMNEQLHPVAIQLTGPLDGCGFPFKSQTCGHSLPDDVLADTDTEPAGLQICLRTETTWYIHQHQVKSTIPKIGEIFRHSFPAPRSLLPQKSRRAAPIGGAAGFVTEHSRTFLACKSHTQLEFNADFTSSSKSLDL
jgi:hypothetical protein